MPATTLAINLVGSILLGFYLARSRRASSPRWLLPFWTIGCLGAFTTFSTFSVEVFDLLASGAVTTAVSYVVLSTVGGVVAALLGQRVGSVGR
jgi:CrcB protein